MWLNMTKEQIYREEREFNEERGGEERRGRQWRVVGIVEA